MHRIGVISDTHGLLRAEALDALAGSDLIVHAGDIGCPTVLDRLHGLAPIHAVQGNMDGEPWARSLPRTATFEVGDTWCYLLHDAKDFDLDPVTAGFAIVVTGHTHRPHQERRDGVLYFNPGSAGPRRGGAPISVGHLVIQGGRIQADWTQWG